MRQAARLATIGIGVYGAIAASPWITPAHGRLVTVTRSLMPWAGFTAAPLAAVAALGGRRKAAAAGLAIAGASAAMCLPLVRRRTPSTRPSAPRLAVVHANLLSANRRVEHVGTMLAALDADVITMSEFTPAHATNLKTTRLVRRYPHRIELVAPSSTGTALWSRYPVTLRPTVPTTHHTVVADVHAPGGDVRIIVIHTQSPIAHHGDWLADLRLLATLDPHGPTIMTGDFNAGWWHPEFRSLLAAGWRDAHLTVGRGLSGSWPTERRHLLFR